MLEFNFDVPELMKQLACNAHPESNKATIFTKIFGNLNQLQRLPRSGLKSQLEIFEVYWVVDVIALKCKVCIIQHLSSNVRESDPGKMKYSQSPPSPVVNKYEIRVSLPSSPCLEIGTWESFDKF